MHKYSFMTSKCPFLHQDVKLTSQMLKSMMTIFRMTIFRMTILKMKRMPILTINEHLNKVKLTMCSSQLWMPHICIMTSVTYRRLTCLIWHLTFVIYLRLTFLIRHLTSVLFWRSSRAKFMQSLLLQFFLLTFQYFWFHSISWSRFSRSPTRSDFENLDQSMISQPVELDQDHSGLPINLQTSQMIEEEKMDEARPLKKRRRRINHIVT